VPEITTTDFDRHGAVVAPSKKSSRTRDGFASTRYERITRSVHPRHLCLASKNWLSKSEQWLKTFEKAFGFMSAKYWGIDRYVGDTPLIRLRRLSKLTGCEILGKAEFMNPGGSVKDRAAYGIITDGERAGQLKPGATIVEGTAGNTGIGLTVIGRARGYRTVIVIPNNQSPEKMHLLRTLGAEVKAVPEKPYKDPENYNHIARRLAEERGWFWANQFDNTANRDAHYRSTGPEIWKQTEGKISSFVAAVGTGGTLSGVSTYLKEQNPNIQIVCADPYGAAMWSWFTNGNLDTNDGDSIAEGIGQGRVTKNIEGIKVDRAYRIPDQIGLTIVYQLLREEGLFLGLSSGINVAGAVRFAKESGPGQTIVTILCDSGHKYQSTLFNRDWLASNHLDPDLPLGSIFEQ
jgi:cysteine synthase